MKTAPILADRGAQVGEIPWDLFIEAYESYAARFGQRQSPERIAERGGFYTSELDRFLPNWRERIKNYKENEKILTLRAAFEELHQKYEWLLCAMIDVQREATEIRREHSVQGHICDLRKAIDSICDRSANAIKSPYKKPLTFSE
jgi:hypothetical protein